MLCFFVWQSALPFLTVTLTFGLEQQRDKQPADDVQDFMEMLSLTKKSIWAGSILHEKVG